MPACLHDDGSCGGVDCKRTIIAYTIYLGTLFNLDKKYQYFTGIVYRKIY